MAATRCEGCDKYYNLAACTPGFSFWCDCGAVITRPIDEWDRRLGRWVKLSAIVRRPMLSFTVVWFAAGLVLIPFQPLLALLVHLTTIVLAVPVVDRTRGLSPLEQRLSRSIGTTLMVVAGFFVVADVGAAFRHSYGCGPGFCCRSVQSEAKSNLKGMFTAQKSYFQEYHQYLEVPARIGFLPAPGNRYTYYLAPTGEIGRRVAGRTLDETFADEPIIGHDEDRIDPLPVTLPATGCPLLVSATPGGRSIGVGVTKDGQADYFIGYAAANLDGDPAYDCWSIATFDRVGSDGAPNPAGTPYWEQRDLDP